MLRYTNCYKKRNGSDFTMEKNEAKEQKPKKVSDSRTEQLRVVIYPDINGFGRLFGGRLLAWIDEVAGATARRHCGYNATTVAIDNLYFKDGAYLNDIPFVIIRAISDKADDSAEMDYPSFEKAAALHSANW